MTVIDLAQGERLPQKIIEALTDNTVIKWAFNANFERVCLSRYLRDLGVGLDPFHDNHPLSAECARFLNPESWRCSMVWAATMGLHFLWKASVPSSVLKTEAHRREKSDQILFRALCSDESKWWSYEESPFSCAGQVGSLQTI